MKALVVVPSIYPPYTQACRESIGALPKGVRYVTIDNTLDDNLGVAGSWNLGVDWVVEDKLDWLIVCSAAMRFRSSNLGGFLSHLATDAYVVGCAYGWHLIAFSRRALEIVGSFDENFYPAYNEDLDWAHRARIAGIVTEPPPFWNNVEVDGYSESIAHGVKLGGVQTYPHELEDYYEAKWGHRPGTEGITYRHPFNDMTKDWRWWPTPPDPRCSAVYPKGE